MKVTLICLLAFAPTVQAFTVVPMVGRLRSVTATVGYSSTVHPRFLQQQPAEESTNEEALSDGKVGKIATGALTAWTLTTQMASAAGPDWGIFEGRTLSLLHPVMMISLLAFSVYTAVLGFNWRRQRTIGDEISALKKTLPDLQGAASVKAALAAVKGAETVDSTPDSTPIDSSPSAVSIEQQIADLTAERKQLAADAPRDKHFNQGALLAFFGTSFAIEGPLNTYARAGKLFPGPHLYAGAGLVVLWALAVSMVPHMQKGNDTARTVHIGANVAGMCLFGWQVVTGYPILLKVLEKTSWP